MHERPRSAFREKTKRPGCTDYSTRQPLVFPLHPTHQVIVDVSPQWPHRGCIKSTLGVRPASKNWVKHVRQISKLFVIHELDVPFAHGLPHDRKIFAADSRRKIHVDTAILVDSLSGSKCVA